MSLRFFTKFEYHFQGFRTGYIHCLYFSHTQYQYILVFFMSCIKKYRQNQCDQKSLYIAFGSCLYLLFSTFTILTIPCVIIYTIVELHIFFNLGGIK